VQSRSGCGRRVGYIHVHSNVTLSLKVYLHATNEPRALSIRECGSVYLGMAISSLTSSVRVWHQAALCVKVGKLLPELPPSRHLYESGTRQLSAASWSACVWVREELNILCMHMYPKCAICTICTYIRQKINMHKCLTSGAKNFTAVPQNNCSNYSHFLSDLMVPDPCHPTASLILL